MTRKKKKCMVWIIVVQSFIQVIFFSVYITKMINNNFENIDRNMQKENVLRFQRYLQSQLQSLKLVAMEYKNNRNLFEWQADNDKQQIDEQVLPRLIEIDGIYYLGIVDPDKNNNIDYYTTDKIRNIIRSMQEEINYLSKSQSEEYLDYYTFDNDVYMVYILPIYKFENGEKLIDEHNQKYMILLRKIDGFFMKQQDYILGLEAFIIGNDIGERFIYSGGSEYSISNIANNIDNRQMYSQFVDSKFQYGQKMFKNKSGEDLFQIQVRCPLTEDIYLFGSYFLLLMLQIAVQLLLVVVVIFYVTIFSEDGNNKKTVTIDDASELTEIRLYLQNIKDRSAKYTRNHNLEKINKIPEDFPSKTFKP